MKTYFTMGTGTGVGKTHVTCLLTQQLRAKGKHVCALKPVISGFDQANAAESDTGLLLGAQDKALTDQSINDTSPWRFAAPLSPDMAAKLEGKEVDVDAVVDFCRAPRDCDILLIESAGGVMSPLSAQHTMLDWAAALGAPVILIAGSYLGTISHTLTAHQALAAKNIPVAGLILSESESSPASLTETRASLSHFLPASLPVATLMRLDSSGAVCSNAPDLTFMAL